MKVAFHFDEDGGEPGYGVVTNILSVLREGKLAGIHSKVLVGNLLLYALSMDSEETPTGSVEWLNKDKYDAIVNAWLNPDQPTWCDDRARTIGDHLHKKLYAVCFESLLVAHARAISEVLSALPYYRGALEVDDTSPIHYHLYSGSLVATLRVDGDSASVFADGFGEYEHDVALVEAIVDAGYAEPEVVSLEGRYSLFDEYHTQEHAARMALWGQKCGEALAHIAESVVVRLGDTAPRLGGKLLDAFEELEHAETDERIAHVALTCRRIVKYVIDSIYPPRSDKPSGVDLGEDKFKNRLWAFCDEARAADESIDIVRVSSKTLYEQTGKLLGLCHKGVHSDICRDEARRCLLRTVMLLDDICAMHPKAFACCTSLDFSWLTERMRKRAARRSDDGEHPSGLRDE